MSVTDSRRYIGLRFGISISASDFPEDLQASPEDYVNRLTFQEAGHILLEGGQLILGHKWEPGGIMDHLASRARDLRMWRGSGDKPSAAVVNVIAWPDAPPDESDSLAQRLISQGILEVHQVAPVGIDVSDADPRSDFGKFCRIRALTMMRKKITELTDIRICLGGGMNKPDRRLSGVLEEALFTINAGKPLYVASALGGVSRLIADALLQRRIPECDQQHFATPDEARRLLDSFSDRYPSPPDEGPSIVPDLPDNSWNALRFLKSQNLNHLATNAHLTTDEYINLLTTADINRAFMLVTLGATRIRQKKTGLRDP